MKFPLFFSGNTPETRGTAFVVYEDIFDAKNACDHLSGFNVCNRYLVVLYYQSNKVIELFVLKIANWLHGWFLQAFKRMDADKKQEELEELKKKYGMT